MSGLLARVNVLTCSQFGPSVRNLSRSVPLCLKEIVISENEKKVVVEGIVTNTINYLSSETVLKSIFELGISL